MSEREFPEHLLDLAAPFALAGWSKADVLHALDAPPEGVSPVFGDPMRWEVARMRLALWLDGFGRPLLSRSQILARAASVKQRDQWLSRAAGAEGEQARSADPVAAAARARRALAEASPAAARAMVRAAEKQGRGRDPGRWRRVDDAAAAAVGSGAAVEAWSPDLGEPEDPVVVARRVSRARALRRARWERAGSSLSLALPLAPESVQDRA